MCRMSDRSPLRASKVRQYRMWIDMNRCSYGPGLTHKMKRQYVLIGGGEVWEYDQCQKCGYEEDDV